MLPPLLISVTTIIFFTKSRSANPLTPEQRIMAMREKSQMALAQIVKLTAGESCNFSKTTPVQINWNVYSLTFPKGVAAGVERVGPVVLKEVKVGDAFNETQ